MNKNCSNCGADFICEGLNRCWCNELPAIMPVEFEQDCRCRKCLTVFINERIQLAIESSQLEGMLALARPFFDPELFVEGIDYTVEHGNTVFSAWYHLKRGSCCGSGCRHCPY